MMRRGRPSSRAGGVIETCALVAGVVALCAVVGASNPISRPGVTTDRLGPDNGETVGEYIGRSEQTLADDGMSDPRWAMVSFPDAVSPRESYERTSSVRIAQVLLRVPLERVQTPVIAVGVPGSEESVLAAEDAAATRLHGSTGQWDRQARIDAVSAARLSSGCDCVVGVIVRATTVALQALDARPDVRSVEALPPDAVAGRFAVRAFLPEYVDVVGPLPDDGDVPTR